MSFQWVPAQLDVEQRSASDSSSLANGWRAGYYVGKGRDEGLYIVNARGYTNMGSSNYGSSPVWIVTEYPFGRFSVSAYTSADTVAESFYMTYSGATGTYSASDRNLERQQIYFGKPVYYGSSYALQYSPTENGYIIIDGYTDDRLSEPCYSTNVLSGGISGDHFWKSSATELHLDTGTGRYSSPVYFYLAGAEDEYKNNRSDYISYFYLEAKPDYYRYTSPSATSADDERPAGEYTNPDSGKKITIGIKCYKGDDNSVWRGFDLCSNSPYYDCVDHGKLRWYTNTDNWGDCWHTVAGAHAPLWVYQTSNKDLPDSFTLQYNSWNEDLSAYQVCSQYNIQMELGPYQLLTADSTVLMGEVSEWR